MRRHDFAELRGDGFHANLVRGDRDGFSLRPDFQRRVDLQHRVGIDGDARSLQRLEAFELNRHVVSPDRQLGHGVVALRVSDRDGVGSEDGIRRGDRGAWNDAARGVPDCARDAAADLRGGGMGIPGEQDGCEDDDSCRRAEQSADSSMILSLTSSSVCGKSRDAFAS